MANYDFAGWASKNNVRCSDGTVIRDGCFADQDGQQVPLVWMHNHNEVGQVLGHAILRNVPGKGTRIEGFFNETEGGKQAKELVSNGDVDSLSIWANHLTRNSRDHRDILHGSIKEVSLVIGGADPEAKIDTILEHGDESDDQAIIWGFGEPEIAHADEDEDEKEEENMDEDAKKNESEETVKDVFDTLTDKQKKAVAIIVGQILDQQKSGGSSDDSESDDVKHADDEEAAKDKKKKKVVPVKETDEDESDEDEDSDEEEEDVDEDESDEDEDDEDKKKVAHADKEKDEDSDSDETVKDVYDSLTPKQKKVVDFLVGKAIEDAKGNKDSDDSEEEEDTVKHNVFEQAGYVDGAADVISHDDMATLMKDTKRMGSMREAFNEDFENGTILAHADGQVAGEDYGIGNVDYLFPDARAIDNQPALISRNMDWVDGVLSAVHRTPFSRVKSIFANITEDEARAKGYIKGKLKKEEVFSLLKRATTPQTVYKKQRLDKDDIDDITEFDIVAWLKTEMQLMLREEIARAILIGDGRLTSDDDHIKEENIRPVYDDADLYTIKFPVEIPANATDDQKAKALMKAQLKARKLYKGSGNMTFYTNEDEITNMLLLENGIGERLYKSEAEVATAMRVSSIVPVPVMEGLKIEIADETGNSKTKYDVAGVSVNLADYNIGTNGGAKTEFFDDFDLNYNQQICLYETRLSGAMVKPYAAITFYYKTATAASTTEEG